MSQTREPSTWGQVCGAPTEYMELLERANGYLQPPQVEKKEGRKEERLTLKLHSYVDRTDVFDVIGCKLNERLVLHKLYHIQKCKDRI